MAFVGRERELAQLARALQRASEGETARVLVTGPAGMGVTSLLDELASRLRDLPGVLIARGHGFEPRAAEPYAIVAEALHEALGRLPDERLAEVAGPAAHDLAALLPGLAARLDALGVSMAPPTLSSWAQIGNRVNEAVLGVIERLAAHAVVLLVLEDLQWADPATRRLVETLVPAARPLRLCLALSYQPDAIHRRHPARAFISSLERGARSADIERLEVRPLTHDELAALAAAVSGERPSGSFAAALAEGSAGNPLLATQLLTAHRALAGLRLSDPFEEVLGARLDALPPDALRAVRLLAAARRPLSRSACLGIRLADGHLSRQALDDAVASGLGAATADTEMVAIAHELYAEAIEALALSMERLSVHAALAASDAVSPAEAAWHWSAAFRPDSARAAHLAAARAAQRLDPAGSTLLQYQAALDVGDPRPDESEPSATRDDLVETLVAAGHAAGAAGSFRRASAFLRRAIDARPRRPRGLDRPAAREAERAAHEREASLLQHLGRYRWASGDLATGMQEMQRAVELVPASPPTELRARALATVAQHLMLDGRFRESAAAAEKARETACATDPVAMAELGHATCTLGVDAAYLGELDRGLALLEEATETARRLGRLDDLMRAHANRTTLLDLDSRREQALAVVNDGIRDASAAGLGATYGAFLRGNAADILFNLGRWAESEVECRAGMAYRPAGVAWFSPILYLGLVLVESRADDEAERLVGQTLLQLEQVPAGQWTALVLRAAVSLLLWRGDSDDAMDVASREWERVMETADAVQVAMAASTALEAAAAVAGSGRLRRDFGAVATAGELAARVLADAERIVAASSLSATLGARHETDLHLETARAHLARLRGRSQAQRWARLAEAWSAIPIPYAEAKARWWQALALLQGGDGRRAAQQPLLEAWRIAGELPAQPLRRALADLAARARIILPDIRSEDLRPAAPARPLVAVGPGVASGVVEAARVAPGEGGGEIAEHVAAERRPAGAADFGLSPRELEVLAVLTQGRTNREIGERLFISDRTVGVHVRRILAKLGVAGRTEAAGKAIRLGLVEEAAESSELARSAGGR